MKFKHNDKWLIIEHIKRIFTRDFYYINKYNKSYAENQKQQQKLPKEKRTKKTESR